MDPREQQKFFKVERTTLASHRGRGHFSWEDEWQEMIRKETNGIDEPDAVAMAEHKLSKPVVDYTDPSKYEYPGILSDPPRQGGYPQMTALGEMMANWDQDEDFDGTIRETLLHFNFSNPAELELGRID